MRNKGVFCQALVWSAAVGLLVPALPTSSQASESHPLIRDVALSADGAFQGQYIGSDGLPVSAAVVVVRANDEAVAESITNVEGRFTIASLQPGVYDVSVGNTTQTIRVWSQVAAPPTAATAALISQPVVRAQYGGGDTLGVVFGITGIALGTVALVQVHNLSNRVDDITSP